MSDPLFPVEHTIYQEVSECVRSLYERGETSNALWTRELKEALYRLCEARDLAPWGIGRESGEWVWDVCWMKVGPKGWKDFRGAYLVCEIEWHPGRDDPQKDPLLADFLKLVVAKADYRLLILHAKTRELAEKEFEKLMNVCPVSEGARYMAIAVMRVNSDELPYRAWTA